MNYQTENIEIVKISTSRKKRKIRGSHKPNKIGGILYNIYDNKAYTLEWSEKKLENIRPIRSVKLKISK